MSIKSAVGLSCMSIICPASNGEQAIGRVGHLRYRREAPTRAIQNEMLHHMHINNLSVISVSDEIAAAAQDRNVLLKQRNCSINVLFASTRPRLLSGQCVWLAWLHIQRNGSDQMTCVV